MGTTQFMKNDNMTWRVLYTAIPRTQMKCLCFLGFLQVYSYSKLGSATCILLCNWILAEIMFFGISLIDTFF